MFLSEFRNLNKQIKRNHIQCLKSITFLLKLEDLKYYTYLGLNMANYHIWLSEYTSNLCTVILPWCKCHSKHFPMQISKPPETFPTEIHDLSKF